MTKKQETERRKAAWIWLYREVKEGKPVPEYMRRVMASLLNELSGDVEI
jgi:hypothetical protein